MKLKPVTRESVRAFIPRFLFCILGNFLIGFGVGMTKLAAFGIDPYNGSCFAVSSFFGIAYTLYTPLFNLFLFIFEILFGRKYIGVGTFINWFLVCYAVSFTLFLFDGLAPTVSASFGLRVVFLAAGLLICCLGIAIYQLCDAGIAPFDVLPIMVCDRLPKLPFFWSRMFFDGLCVALIFIFHGSFGDEIGIGTLITAFCLGPVIHFFTFLIERFILKRPRTGNPA
ncbi:MAG: hypothetical protein MJ192_09370 [Clostridia bacterium]|nr:hypothetical protein [Clostridia bacterium]